MKKIFLTSGIVLCMACPAFADDPAPHYDINNDTNHTLQNDPNNGNATCQYPTLGTYTEDTTFNAKWQWKTSTITLDNNIYPENDTTETASYVAGATGANITTTSVPAAVYGAYDHGVYESNAYAQEGGNTGKITTLAGTPSRPGYTFNGYYYGNTQVTNASGVLQGTPANLLGDATVGTWYAHWSQNTYNVTYHQGTAKNGSQTHTETAEAVTASVQATYDNNYTILANTDSQLGFSHYGYTFNGWKADYNIAEGTAAAFTDNDLHIEGGQSYAAGATPLYKVTNPDGINLYAQWTAKPHTVAYDCGATGGSEAGTGSAPETQNVAFDQTFNLSEGAGTCAFKGWTFAGWDCSINIEDNSNLIANANSRYEYSDNASVTLKVDNDVTCYARWTANVIDLEWHAGSGAKESADSDTAYTTVENTCTYEGSITVPTAPYRTGYTFQGWTTKSEAPSGAGYTIFED